MRKEFTLKFIFNWNSFFILALLMQFVCNAELCVHTLQSSKWKLHLMRNYAKRGERTLSWDHTKILVHICERYEAFWLCQIQSGLSVFRKLSNTLNINKIIPNVIIDSKPHALNALSTASCKLLKASHRRLPPWELPHLNIKLHACVFKQLV